MLLQRCQYSRISSKYVAVVIQQLFLIAFILHSSNKYCVARKPRLKPIVIVPGIGGSVIEAKLHRNETTHYWCYKKTTHWFTLWLNIEELLPMAKECWVDNIKLVLNNSTGKMENTPGVTTKVPHFGNTTAIEFLDPTVHSAGVYFYPLVQTLCRFGYVRGESLTAAPYDFRYDPGATDEYLRKLKELVEQTYLRNGKQKVMFLSHSMGAPYGLYFLNHQSSAWKDFYIDSWITISGAYAGSVNAVLAYISGDAFGIPRILDKPKTLREFQRTFPSLAFILPDSRFWESDEVIVKTHNRTYGVEDYVDLFHDMGYPLGSKIISTVPKPWSDEHPGVNVFCFYGSEVPTSMTLNYPAGYFPDYYPKITHGSGDGTVPLRSLKACERWRDTTSKNFSSKVFTGAEHNAILGDARLIRSVLNVLGIKGVDVESIINSVTDY